MTRVSSFLLAAALLLALLPTAADGRRPKAADNSRKCHVCTCDPNGDPSKYPPPPLTPPGPWAAATGEGATFGQLGRLSTTWAELPIHAGHTLRPSPPFSIETDGNLSFVLAQGKVHCPLSTPIPTAISCNPGPDRAAAERHAGRHPLLNN